MDHPTGKLEQLIISLQTRMKIDEFVDRRWWKGCGVAKLWRVLSVFGLAVAIYG